MPECHKHLIVDANCLTPPTDPAELEEWFYRLVELVNMKVAIHPRAVYVNDPGNEGLTGQVAITTSHSSIHVWDKENPPYLRFDLYSCRHFDTVDVIHHLQEFGIYNVRTQELDRA